MIAGLAKMLAFVIRPIAWPGWFIEKLASRYWPGWQFSPYSAVPYLGSLATLGSYLAVCGGSIVNIIGLYILLSMELLCIWICAAIASGSRSQVHALLYQHARRSLEQRNSEQKSFSPRALFMGIFSYCFTVYLFAILGFKVEAALPGSYEGLSSTSGPARLWQFAYFSAMTITTVGYGDIHPLKLPSQFLAIAEVFLGHFFLIFVIGAFVSVHISRVQQRDEVTSR